MPPQRRPARKPEPAPFPARNLLVPGLILLAMLGLVAWAVIDLQGSDPGQADPAQAAADAQVMAWGMRRMIKYGVILVATLVYGWMRWGSSFFER